MRHDEPGFNVVRGFVLNRKHLPQQYVEYHYYVNGRITKCQSCPVVAIRECLWHAHHNQLFARLVLIAPQTLDPESDWDQKLMSNKSSQILLLGWLWRILDRSNNTTEGSNSLIRCWWCWWGTIFLFYFFFIVHLWVTLRRWEGSNITTYVSVDVLGGGTVICTVGTSFNSTEKTASIIARC